MPEWGYRNDFRRPYRLRFVPLPAAATEGFRDAGLGLEGVEDLRDPGVGGFAFELAELCADRIVGDRSGAVEDVPCEGQQLVNRHVGRGPCTAGLRFRRALVRNG